MKNQGERAIRRTLALFFLLFFGIFDSEAFYYGEPSEFSSASATFEQIDPDIQFDTSGQLHMVWTDSRDGYPHIYHRYRDRAGHMEIFMRADQETLCDFQDCHLSKPEIVFNSLNEGMMSCYSNYSSSPSLPGSIFRSFPSPGNWTFIAPGATGSNDILEGVSLASYGIHFFLAYEDGGAIKIVKYSDLGWESTYTTPYADGITLSNPDLATDSSGYIFMTCDEYNTNNPSNPRRVVACKSINTDDVSAFYPLRQVNISNNSSWEGRPSIDAFGNILFFDLAVAIAYIDTVAGEPFVYCICEEDDNWSSSSALTGNRSQVCSWSSGIGKSPQNPDIAFGKRREIHVAWQDARSGQGEVYAAVSYNLASHFLRDQLISRDSAYSGEATYPNICVHRIKNDVAISYQRRQVSTHHLYATGAISDFYDDGLTYGFPFWTSSVGVANDLTFGYDPPSYRLESNSVKGQLLKDFGPGQATGSIELNFYDSGSITEDFFIRIDGDDGGKAGVYRMIGINNASTSTNYSIHAGSGSWVDSGIPRGLPDWHHVLISISEDGIEIYLDPETYYTALHQSANFVWYNLVTISGGSDDDPYYIDDIRIVSDVNYIVPSMNVTALIIVLSGLTFFIRRSRFISKRNSP